MRERNNCCPSVKNGWGDWYSSGAGLIDPSGAIIIFIGIGLLKSLTIVLISVLISVLVLISVIEGSFITKFNVFSFSLISLYVQELIKLGLV